MRLGTIVKHILARANNCGLGPALKLSYNAAVLLAKHRLFDSYDEVVALYVRRSFASDDAIPGQSDIDLCAICSSNISELQIKSLRKRYAGLSKVLPVFPKDELEIHKTNDISNILDRRSHFNASLLFGVHNWKHVAGQDVFQSVLGIDFSDELICHFEELKTWIAHFFSDIFEIDKRDLISRRHLWYKVLAESLKFHSFVKNDASPNRQEALLRYRDNHVEYLNHKSAWESALKMRSHTFSFGELPPTQDRYRLFSAIFAKALYDLESRLVSADKEKISFETNMSVNDLHISNKIMDAIGEINKTLLFWGIADSTIAVRTFIGLDDLAIFVNPPIDFPVQEFKHLNVYLDSVPSPQNMSVYFCGGPNAAVSIFPVIPKNADNVLVCTFNDPFVFECRFKPEAVLHRNTSDEYSNKKEVFNFSLPTPFSTEWKNNIQYDCTWIENCLASGEPLTWDVVRFHKFFWKALQLTSWASSVKTRTNHHIISITSKQILAQAKTSYKEHEVFLDEFYCNYVKALNGEVTDTIKHYDAALKVLSGVLQKSAAQNR